MDFTLTEKDIAECRELLEKAKPYKSFESNDHEHFFDYSENMERDAATLSMELLKSAGLWTEEDEKRAFG